MTYVDYAAATRVSDGVRDGMLVFKLDTQHPGFGTLPLEGQHGFIAFEFTDDNDERQFERLALDMTLGESDSIVAPYPTGFARDTGGCVPLSAVTDHIAAALKRSNS